MASRSWARRGTHVLVASALAATVITACSDSKEPAGPQLPGPGGPAAALKPVAFIADVDLRRGSVRISSPTSTTIDQASLSLSGDLGPNLSLLGGEAVRLIPTNYQASAVGAFIPGKIRVTFDVVIENKLPGIQFITPTWPVPPSPGVILVPLEQTVVTTPGGVTGGDGNEVIVEQPSYGLIVPSIDWNGDGSAGSGSPFNFFNDSDCGLSASNDCFRWEAYGSPVLPAPALSEVHSIGFDLDPTVGVFRARMIVAADLAPAGVVEPGTVTGTVTSAVRGPLAGVTVTVNGAPAPATTDATGAYSVPNVPPGTRSVSLSGLPAGCSTPAAQQVGVASGGTATANFAVDCTGLPGTVGGVVTRSNDGSVLSGVTVTATGGASDLTDAAGAYSIGGVPAGAGNLIVTGAPAECSASSTPYTMPNAGTITVDIVVTCGAPPVPGYQYTAVWSALPGNQVALELRIDMRTFNRADITDITTAGALGGTGDPLTGAQLSFTYDQTKLTFNTFEATSPPFITAGPTVNGGTPGSVSVLAGNTTLQTGYVGIVRIIFDRVAGSTGSVSTVTNLIAASSRTGTTTVNIRTNVVVNEGSFILP